MIFPKSILSLSVLFNTAFVAAHAFSAPSVTDITPTTQIQSPLSLDFDALTKTLQAGEGRSRAAWECFRMGIDPVLMYDPNIDESRLDASVTDIIKTNDKETNKKWTRDDLKMLITAKRRSQGLGKPALELLQGTCQNGIEDSIATISEISISADGTTKLLVKLIQDGLEVEAVIIPWNESGKSTLCISSQVGCRQGCTFCATGRMGKLRNLSSSEILSQVFLARKVCRVLDIFPVDGIVYMGMGEASDNAEAVVQSAKVLTNQEQFGMAKRKITISTVGPSPEAFEVLGEAPAVLAWSVHASSDKLRKELVPTTKYSMEELKQGYLNALLKRPIKLRTTMLEIVLIDGINDSVEDADHLANFVESMIDMVPGMKPMVNLIPYNSIGYGKFKKPKQESMLIFQKRLTSRGIKCFVRTTRGDEESAACGQLATKKKKESPVA
jgi:23S rRNA (adenine2503-C2)-methyltransferase